MKKRTFLNLLLFAFIGSFFFTSLGYESKVFLQKILATSVDILPENQQYTIDENWILKDKHNHQFNFNQSKGKVKFVYFWSSWRTMSVADLSRIDNLYNQFKSKIDFYVITNELPELPEKTIKDRKYSFPITYLIIGEKMPFDAEKIPSGYIIDKNSKVVAQAEGNSRWDSQKIFDLIENLIK